MGMMDPFMMGPDPMMMGGPMMGPDPMMQLGGYGNGSYDDDERPNGCDEQGMDMMMNDPAMMQMEWISLALKI